jgi:TRAP-type C4-dicarboxylate transport system permease small subunit
VSARVFAVLTTVSTVFAVVGGLLLIALAGMVTTSVTIRSDLVGGRGVPGDFELVQMGTALAAFSFLALCQARRGNIMVDSFTGFLPRAVTRRLDAFWDVVYAVAMAVIGWRLMVGASDELRNGTTTMVLAIPTGYAIMACGVLALFVAAVTVVGALIHARPGIGAIDGPGAS